MDSEEMRASVTPGRAVLLARRWLPVFAGTLGGMLIWFVISDYAVSVFYAIFAPDHLQLFTDVWLTASFALWWAFIALSCVLGALVVVCWRSRPEKGGRALRLIGIGLVLTWFLRLVIGALEDWGFSQIALENQDAPQVMVLGTVFTLVNQAIDLLAAGLLIAGAVRWRRRAETTPRGSAQRGQRSTSRAKPR